MNQTDKPQKIVMDWEHFFRDYRRICQIKLSWATPAPSQRRQREPGPVVEVTISSKGEQGTTMQITIGTEDADRNQPVTISPDQVATLAEVLQEATDLARELKKGFHEGHFATRKLDEGNA